MARLFIAVNFPSALRREAWDASAPLRRSALPVRWVAPEALHLTLKFLGEVESPRESAVLAAMHDLAPGSRPFTLSLGGFGAFPSVERPRVVWLGCEGVPALELLQHAVEQRMHALGFPLEGRPFRPHLTLGRVRSGGQRRERDPPDLGALLDGLDFTGAATIESLDLMESRLGPDGPRYSVRQAVPLGDR